MKKRIALFGMAALLTLSMVLFLACPTDDPKEEELPLASLKDSVWAGETPREHDWVTLTFKDLTSPIAGSEAIGRRVIASFAIDNSTNNWGYTYNAIAKTGAITSTGWNPAPEGFSVSQDNKTMIIKNYGGHEADRSYKRLRDTDLAVDSEPYTAGTSTTKEGLLYSVWGGSTPQANNTGWLTITFNADDKVIAAFSGDNTTNQWACTDYDAAERTGTLTGAGSWLDGGAFIISEDGKTLTFTSFMGTPRDFKRYR
ncbi:MAG: hypothetical protein LBQ88_07725 [Treponema sp.]|jgi:hypothetical protein|nr:hypothetical protein [Treponema sp.]